MIVMNNQSDEHLFTKHVLLLGAGFTKNFGGLLAEEMWIQIFNDEKVQAQPRIKKLMLDNFDYEDVYYSVLENLTDKKGFFLPIEFTSEEKEAIQDATKFAYKYIDEILRKRYEADVLPFNDVISMIRTQGKNYKVPLNDGRTCFLHPDTKSKSFIFTLNQDLFFERLYSKNAYAELSIPGIPNDPKWFTSRFHEPLEEEDYVKLPSKKELITRKDDPLKLGNFFLIKLHGSYNWKSSNGSDIMVIGRGKTKQIKNEPLLSYYSEVFSNVLSQDQCRLVVIGYSFGDEHINRVISDAVEKNGLKIYILSPESPKKLKEKLSEGCKTKETMNIWNGISGYSQKVEGILTSSSHENETVREQFYNILFGKNIND